METRPERRADRWLWCVVIAGLIANFLQTMFMILFMAYTAWVLFQVARVANDSAPILQECGECLMQKKMAERFGAQ